MVRRRQCSISERQGCSWFRIAERLQPRYSKPRLLEQNHDDNPNRILSLPIGASDGTEALRAFRTTNVVHMWDWWWSCCCLLLSRWGVTVRPTWSTRTNPPSCLGLVSADGPHRRHRVPKGAVNSFGLSPH